VHDYQTVFPENDKEQETLPSLDKPGWYSQGNAVHLYELLKKMTGKPEPKVFSDGGRIRHVHLQIQKVVN
jgi:hypothetical protein